MNPIRTLLLTAVVALALAGPMLAQDVQNGDGIDEAQLMIFDTPRYIAVVDDARSIRRDIGEGYQVIDVQMRGWELDFQSDDHHIDGIGVEIFDVSYNPDTGNVTFSVRVRFIDKFPRGIPFFWKVRYAILALG